MSVPPRDLDFNSISPDPPPAEREIAAKPVAELDSAPPISGGTLSYATRFAAQRYHPVIFVGSSAAGKTVLLLSLLAYFKGGDDAGRLAAVFGDDFYKSSEKGLRDFAKNYFDRTVANYIRGETDQKTAITTPMFIPVKVSGESQADLKFVFMESDGEKF